MFGYARTHFVTKTILIIVASVTLVSALSIAYFNSRYERRLRETFAADVETTRQLIEGSYPEPLWNMQAELLRTLNEAVLSAPPYLAIVVYDVDETGVRRINQSTRKLAARKRVGYAHSKGPVFLDEGGVEVARGRLFYRDKAIGEYDLYYTRAQISDHLRNNLFNLTGSFLLISLALVLTMVVLLNQFLVKKLFAIIDFAKGVAIEEAYDRRIELESQDEIGVLADSINDMLAQIERRDKEKDLVGRELLESKSYLQSLFDAIPDALFVLEPIEGRILDVNRSTCNLFGFSREQMIGRCIGDSPPPYDMAAVKHLFEKVRMEGFQTVPWLSRRQDGSLFWTEVNLSHSVIGGGSRFIALVRDITERRHAEEALRESEQKFHILFRQSPIALSLSNLEGGRFVDVNDALAEQIGYSREEIIGKTPLELGFWAKLEQRQECLDLLRERGRVSAHPLLIRDRAGGLHSVLWSAEIVPMNGVPYLVTSAIDVTERKRTDEALRQVRQYLANIIDSMPSILVGVDLEGRVTQWNVQAQRSTGLSAAAAAGQPLEKAFPRLAAEMQRARNAMDSRETQTKSRLTRKEGGEIRYEDVTVFPLVADGVQGAVIRVDDVTEHVRIEEMMLQGEKMLSVGGLAAGMAHEINNPLGGMIQTASVMGERLSNADLPANRQAAEEAGTTMGAITAFMQARGIFRMLENIRKSGSRAAEIVSNMLSFARKDDLGNHLHDMAELLDRCVDLAGSDYDLKKKTDFRQVEVVREYEAGIPPVPCQSGKIQQVLLNILRNGAEAMQEGGTQGRKHAFTLRLAHEKELKRVRIEIEDNGPGMDEATRRRVFEPFFTTKPIDRGTGLGLSVSYFIVTENHGGEMRVESEPGKGAKFTIWLPLEKGEA